PTLFPYTTLFRSRGGELLVRLEVLDGALELDATAGGLASAAASAAATTAGTAAAAAGGDQHQRCRPRERGHLAEPGGTTPHSRLRVAHGSPRRASDTSVSILSARCRYFPRTYESDRDRKSTRDTAVTCGVSRSTPARGGDGGARGQAPAKP